MKVTGLTYRIVWALLTMLFMTISICADAQNESRASRRRRGIQPTDSIQVTATDSIEAANQQQLKQIQSPVVIDVKEADSVRLPKKIWIPNPTKATWMALVFPGGGQIYNKKYWKLPIFYAGFAGCAYALTWNNRMYKDYSAAYKDAVNNNWTAKSITELLKRRKDTYRRYRDISVFAFIAVYALSVVDAYVDAELSNFDISPDLSMRVEPAVIDNQWSEKGGLGNQSVGVQCSLKF